MSSDQSSLSISPLSLSSAPLWVCFLFSLPFYTANKQLKQFHTQQINVERISVLTTLCWEQGISPEIPTKFFLYPSGQHRIIYVSLKDSLWSRKQDQANQGFVFIKPIHVLAKLPHSCLTYWDPMDCNLPSSSILGIFQARILDWVAMPFSRGSSQPRDWSCISCVSCLDRWAHYH